MGCRSVPVFTKRMHDATITVNMDSAESTIESVRLKKHNGGSELFERVEGDVYTSVPPEGFDETANSKFHLESRIVEGVSGNVDRKLRGASTLSPEEDEARRQLQTSCTTFREVEVAVAVESSYCAAVGGEANVEAAVAKVMEAVSEDYQQDGLCWKVKVVYLEKFCDPNDDPYAPGVALNLSGCGDTYPGL